MKSVLLHLRDIRAVRLLLVKFFGGATVLGTGFSLGREGPTIHLGAAVADGVAKVLKVPKKSKYHLIACGGGAGLAAAFNATLAGFIFVIEELRRELSPITYGVAFVAAVTADAVTRFIVGPHPSLRFTILEQPNFSSVWIVALVSLFAAGAGILFNKVLLRGAERVPDNWKLWQRGAAVGAAIGLMTVTFPLATGNIQETFDALLQVHSPQAVSLFFCMALLISKFLLTIASYLTGVPGGIFAPMLIQGALVGVVGGRLVSLGWPASTLPDAMYALVGMCGFFAASVRAPLTGVVLIAEMTGNFNLLFLLLISGLVGYLFGEIVGQKPIYESLMELSLRKAGRLTGVEEEATIVDLVIEPQSPADGKTLRSITLPPGCLIITVRQRGREHVPHGDTKLAAGDELVVLLEGGSSHHIHTLREIAATAT